MWAYRVVAQYDRELGIGLRWDMGLETKGHYGYLY